MAISYVWTTDSGTMDLSIQAERKLYIVRGFLPSAGVIAYWTTDGTPTTGSLFSSTVPWVEVLVRDATGSSRISGMGYFGPMIAQGVSGDRDQYLWETRWDAGNSLWYTVIYLRGATGDDAASGDSAGREFFAYAMGK